MLATIYYSISLIFLAVTAILIALFLLRLLFNYTDPNPFGAIGRFSYQLKKRTDKFVYPAARLLAQFKIDTRLAPVVTIIFTAIISYFLLDIVQGTIFIIAGFTDALTTSDAKLLIGYTLYALVSVYILFIFIRFLASWFVFSRNTFLGFVQRVTDPVLIPARRLIPTVGMFDISAMLVLILLGFVKGFILRAFIFQ